MASRTAYSTWTPQKPTLFDGYYLRNRSTLDKCVLGYIGIVQHKEHSPEVLSIPPGTPCIQGVPGGMCQTFGRVFLMLKFHCGGDVFPSNHAQRTIEILQLPFFLDRLVFWLILASMVFEIALAERPNKLMLTESKETEIKKR